MVSEIRGKLEDYQKQAKELDARLQAIAGNLGTLTGQQAPQRPESDF